MSELASNEEWKKWGEIDPLFGVAAWNNKAKDGADPWTDQEFYQTGSLDWQAFKTHWEMYGVNRESCLEIGCGAGRITMQLASYFNDVHALDVSEKMIEYAQKRITSSSVSFHLTNGITIPLSDQSVFSVFSTHVFQHFDSWSVAESYFAQIARIMKPGGTMMIHLPIYRWPSTSRILRLVYAGQKTIENIRARGNRLLMKYGLAKPFMRWLLYPTEYFYEVLPKHGFDSIELTVFAAGSNNDAHPFVFAKKKT